NSQCFALTLRSSTMRSLSTLRPIRRQSPHGALADRPELGPDTTVIARPLIANRTPSVGSRNVPVIASTAVSSARRHITPNHRDKLPRNDCPLVRGLIDRPRKPAFLAGKLRCVSHRARVARSLHSRLDHSLHNVVWMTNSSQKPVIEAVCHVSTTPSPLLGRSPEIMRLRGQLSRVAGTDLCLLVAGETGVGKEVVAREVHHLAATSAGPSGPFVVVDCPSIGPAAAEIALFGAGEGAADGS